MLRWPFALIANFFALLLLPWWALRRARAAGSSGWLELKLEGPQVEFPSPLRWRFPLSPAPVALHSARQALREAAADPRVVGLQVTLATSTGGGALTQSWHDALFRFRESGKPIVVYLPNGGGTRDYYLAAAGNKLLMGPDARLAPLGFAVESPYLRKLLLRGGLEVEVFARGEFKTAGEPLVRDEMSAAQRHQLGQLLDQQLEIVLAGIQRGRGTSRETVVSWLDQGPFGAQRALEHGLVDGLAYADEVAGHLSPAPRATATPVLLNQYARRRAMLLKRLSPPAYLAVVSVHGVIASAAGPFSVADEPSFSESMKRAREDRRALGLLLHIDSRGGSALASARMLHEVRRCAAEKPVVAYFSNTAASGGYMIGVGAHLIVAQSACVTGSIGVVAARLVLQALLERLGVKMEVVQRGARANMWSVARFMEPGARAAFETELDEVYQRFLQQVAVGRKMTLSDVEAVAGGRVWSGEAAHAHGLLDELGDCELALARLRELIGTPAAQRANPRQISSKRRPFAKAPLGRFMDTLPERLLRAGMAEVAAIICDPTQENVLAWEPSVLGWGQ